ncbi:hypothetical protein [Salinimicrobium xinjiangense]|uniref:hypothetical protein n=1 Tax=Salinimicrobium xinjiangense TaxID=438596 RepID=UPI00048B0782|nr:hypothetical protein [Salinimicrobium xinjiangense]
MKLFITLLLLVSATLEQQAGISEIRSYYLKAAEQEAAANTLMKVTTKSDISDPLMYGYRAAAHMMIAKHVGNPFKKLSNFNKGKEIFSKAIEADPSNVELRFLRFSVQAEAPAFLNYKQNLEEDKRILLNGTPQIEDAELQKIIRDYLISSKELSNLEKEKL